MFFGIDIFGLNKFSSAFYIPKKSYKSVKFLGNTIIDAVHIRNKILTNDEIEVIINEEYWGENSLLLANFDGDLQAGNYKESVNPITNWIVKRKKYNSFTPVKLATLNREINEYIDYTQANNTDYEYQLYPVFSTGIIGSAMTTNAKSGFFGWILSTLDGSTIYKFDMELESDVVSLNTSVKVFDNHTKYPVVVKGKRMYHSGGLKTIPYAWNGNDITFNHSLLEEIETFISNGDEKLLKNTKGDIWRVQTSDFNYKYMDTIADQPFTITFKFTEVGAVE